MSTIEARLEAIEGDLKWLHDWMVFLVCQFYEVENLSQVSEAQRLLTESYSPLPEATPGWVI